MVKVKILAIPDAGLTKQIKKKQDFISFITVEVPS